MITIEAIKTEQKKIAEMIAKFESQESTEYLFPETEIKLKPGEHYSGIILGKTGEYSYHLILLAGEAEDVNWSDAKEYWRYYLNHATEDDAADALAEIWGLANRFESKHKPTSDRLRGMVSDGEAICAARFGDDFAWLPF